MSTAGAEHQIPTLPASFIEESTSTTSKDRLTPEQIRAKTERILQNSKASLKSMETEEASANHDTPMRTVRAEHLMQEEHDKEASDDASIPPTTMRFSEATSKVESTARSLLAEVAQHSRKSADALSLAAKLRRHALDVAQHGKLSADTGLTGLTEVADRQGETKNFATVLEKLEVRVHRQWVHSSQCLVIFSQSLVMHSLRTRGNGCRAMMGCHHMTHKPLQLI